MPPATATGSLADPGPRPAFPGPRALVSDIRRARRALRRIPLPAGENSLSVRRTWRARHDVLNLLLEAYYRHGPISVSYTHLTLPTTPYV